MWNSFEKTKSKVENRIVKRWDFGKRLYFLEEVFGWMKDYTDLYIENDKCFEKVVLLNHTGNILELNCNKNFWIVCKSAEAEFFCSYPDGRTEILIIENFYYLFQPPAE